MILMIIYDYIKQIIAQTAKLIGLIDTTLQQP